MTVIAIIIVIIWIMFLMSTVTINNLLFKQGSNKM
jgi:hypothetical protein